MARGRLILCGSGEFTPAMEAVDREILAGIAAARPRVAIVPTAAGQEETPRSWIAMGTEHFGALGAEPIGLMVLDRDDANDPRWTAELASVDWIYFSGGRPGYAVRTLGGTPFWRAVVERHRAGAVLAGSSAGAMMLAERTLAPRDFDEDGMPRTVTMEDGLGLIRGVFVAPHFDRVSEERWAAWAVDWPPGLRMLGIDEDTALIEQRTSWSVRGRGRVVTLGSATDRSVYTDGASLDGIIVVDA